MAGWFKLLHDPFSLHRGLIRVFRLTVQHFVSAMFGVQPKSPGALRRKI
jgi:hypothetical protein